MNTIPRLELVVKEAGDKPHNVSFTRTVKGGWRPDGLKVYFADDDAEAAMAAALRLMRRADETAHAANEMPEEEEDHGREEFE